MRNLCLFLVFTFFLLSLSGIFAKIHQIQAQPEIQILNQTENHNRKQMESIIVEVEGNPIEHKKYIETYYPYIEVVRTYDQLFNGLALKAMPNQLAKMGPLDFVIAVHPVRQYKVNVSDTEIEPLTMEEIESNPELILPHELNTTTYTGKGVKVGVIDTGIDYNHEDLSRSYKGGYDLVDLDDDPMESTSKQGIPTLHGTHVAGIIASNGELKGVAPDAELYAYRALGPGGMGTSIQVIAAMEQAVNDGVDIINLSLGNAVNGPDYPTSIAVNRAAEQGIAVVIANGNNGPELWTVGAPATASDALSVGASSAREKTPYLYEPLNDKQISILPMAGSIPWELKNELKLAPLQSEQLRGNIALIQRGEVPFYDLALRAQRNGAEAVLIYNNEAGPFQGSIAGDKEPITIPVASVSREDGEWLQQYSEKKTPYIKTLFHEVETGIASFSSRGPVTANWEIKPDVIAPGTNIVSTVPGGYQALQGTSMAAPHVAGLIALMKEAHPDWNNKKIIESLKTHTYRLEDENGHPLEPTIQGNGKVNPELALESPTTIYNPSLTFGKIDRLKESKVVEFKVENNSNKDQTYYFDIPNKKKGLTWKLPPSFIVEKQQKKTIPIELSVTTSFLEKGIHQGWLTLNGKHDSYYLPYLFINETADYPRAAGFEFELKPFSEDEYMYRLYLTEAVQHVAVELYEPATLIHNRNLIELGETEEGMLEGVIHKTELGEPGNYRALVTVQLQDGTYKSYETEIMIEPDG